jgi:hypothetical protein
MSEPIEDEEPPPTEVGFLDDRVSITSEGIRSLIGISALLALIAACWTWVQAVSDNKTDTVLLYSLPFFCIAISGGIIFLILSRNARNRETKEK